MNPKERMRRAICYEAVDRLPTQINYTAGMGARLAQHYGVTVIPASSSSWLVTLTSATTHPS